MATVRQPAMDLESAKRVVLVVAHPDDEVIGAGIALASLHDVYIIHTTDGSPKDLSDARRSGFHTREEYANARRMELDRALSLVGVPSDRATMLGFTDQETMRHLPELCDVLRSELLRLNPDVVLTQPYEGGHPDHDSTAFAVHRVFRNPDRIFEMTSYHAENGAMVTGRFLPNGGAETVADLSPAERDLKERMLACFKSQAWILQYFPVVPERFRRAPRYDFTQAPHPGQLNYERSPWGITGEAWRKLAAACV